ncbi:MAG: protein kinase [Gemmataceae bacterium]
MRTPVPVANVSQIFCVETIAASAAQDAISKTMSSNTDGVFLAERYQLIHEIASGGMGIVYLAKDVRLNRDVAIKLLLDQFTPDSETASRFIEEAYISGQLQHPGIAPVHDFGKLKSGRPFLAMKLIKGQTLSKILSSGERASSSRDSAFSSKLNRSKTASASSSTSAANGSPAPSHDAAETSLAGSYNLIEIYLEIAQTIAFAHSKGVIHRDLKPSNIMVGAFGEVQVMDWGLAKVLQNETAEKPEQAPAPEPSITSPRSFIQSDRTPDSATLAGSVMGTPSYMPPEQAKGEIEKTDARSDVFSLGAILCEMLTGAPPYTGSFDEVRARSIIGDTKHALERLANCGADDELITLATHCLEANPDQRPAHAGEIVAALKAYRSGVTDRLKKAERENAASEIRLLEQTKRRRVWLALIALLIVGTATSFVLTVLSSRQAARADQASDFARKEMVNASERAEEVVKANLESQKQKERAEKQLMRAERLVYADTIGEAQRHWIDGRIELASQALNACRLDLRGFEHDLFFTRLNEGSVAFHGHGQRVNGLVFLSDRYRIASASDDQTIRIWDTRTGACLQTLSGHAEAVTCLAIDPRGKQLASGSLDGTIRIWDLATGMCVNVLNGQSDSIKGLAYSPDGRSLVATSWQAVLNVWEISTGRKQLELRGHQSGVSSAVFSPDGRQIVSGSLDATVKRWDASNGTCLSTWKSPTQAVTCVSVSPDGKLIVSGSRDGRVHVWDVAKEKAILSLSHGEKDITSIAFRPDGSRFVTGSLDATIQTWDAENGHELSKEWGHTGPISGLVYDPDGRRLASSSHDRTVRLWQADHSDHEPAVTLQPANVSNVARNHDQTLLVSPTDYRTLLVSDARTKQPIAELRGHSDRVSSVHFHPDGSRLVTTSSDKEVWLWETSNWTNVVALKGHAQGVYNASFSADGKTLVSGADQKSIRVWHARMSQPHKILDDNRQSMVRVAFRADGQRIYARDKQNRPYAWITATGKPVSDDEAIPDFEGGLESWTSDRAFSVRIEAGFPVLRDEAKWLRFEAEMKRRLRDWSDANFDWHAEAAHEAELAGHDFALRFHLRLILNQCPTDWATMVRLAEVEARFKGKEQPVQR